MTKIMILFFLLSIFLFAASLHFLFAIKKPGVYPPKYILKRRSGTMAVGSGIFFMIGFIIHLFH